MSVWIVGARAPGQALGGRLSRRRRSRLASALVALVALVGSACAADGPPSCVTVDPQCAPRYQPTFSNVYSNTLKDSCGSQSVACHSAAGRKGGLSMESASVALRELTTAGRVVAGDPSCSEVVVRMHGGDAAYLMPPGAPLPLADRCAIEQWIAAGALDDAATLQRPGAP